MEKQNLIVNEIFTSIQGEGRYTGYPSVFIRTNGCNLRCCFKDGLCDTPYTSHNPEVAAVLTPEELSTKIGEELDKIGGHPDNSHIVITGGEPMIQQQALIDLIQELSADDLWNKITIETNGTVIPADELLGTFDIMWSVSPKLSTSCCFEGTDVPEALRVAHCDKRINIEALAKIVMNAPEYQLKFVYSGPECIDEIDDIIARIRDYVKGYAGDLFGSSANYNLDHIDTNILLMPEGATEEQLRKSAQEAADVCIRRGWRYCDRTHIRIWGEKRAV